MLRVRYIGADESAANMDLFMLCENLGMDRAPSGRALVTVLVLGALTACSKTEAPPPPTPVVEVVEIGSRSVPVVFSRVAQTESSREVEVVARVSGFLEKIVYEEGTPVNEGDVMFLMDRKPFEARLNAAKGELEASKARLWTANANLKRTKPLPARAAAAPENAMINSSARSRCTEPKRPRSGHR